jgi:glycosyltransferase involved in cell wall biosynthesis
MNVLQVISSARTSGAEKHMALLSAQLLQRGHNVLAVCPPGGWLSDRLRSSGIRTVEMPMHGLRSPGAILRLRRAAREHGAQLIHAHLTRATYLGYFAGALARVPVVSTVHVLTRDFAYRRLPPRNLWFVAVSDYLRQALIARGLSPGRVQTVYNGTDFGADDRIIPAPSLSVRAELGLPADAELVGLIGRVDSFKGHPLLVRAARDIVECCPRVYFVFVGHAEPGVQQTLWEMASADGVDDRLRFTGVRNDVPRLMEAMDVITLPSLTEACSMSIIEAMAMRRPVVATRAGGNLELVENERTGLLVERTPEALSEAIIRLLQDPSRRAAMGQAGHDRALSLFSAQAMAQNIENLYRRVLEQRAR